MEDSNVAQSKGVGIPAKYHTRAEQLATAHWSYIFERLTAHNVDDNTIAVAEFHYKSAAVHFYKHAIEDVMSKYFYPDKGRTLYE